MLQSLANMGGAAWSGLDTASAFLPGKFPTYDTRMQKAIVIANLHAGRSRRRFAFAELVALLNLRGISASLAETAHPLKNELFGVGVKRHQHGGRRLVIGQYGNEQWSTPKPKPMDIYDVSNPDCSKPKFLETFTWPENIHNLTISGNGRYVFATQPLQVLDIDPLFDGDGCQPPNQTCHRQSPDHAGSPGSVDDRGSR